MCDNQDTYWDRMFGTDHDDQAEQAEDADRENQAKEEFCDAWRDLQDCENWVSM